MTVRRTGEKEKKMDTNQAQLQNWVLRDQGFHRNKGHEKTSKRHEKRRMGKSGEIEKSTCFMQTYLLAGETLTQSIKISPTGYG